MISMNANHKELLHISDYRDSILKQKQAKVNKLLIDHQKRGTCASKNLQCIAQAEHTSALSRGIFLREKSTLIIHVSGVSPGLGSEQLRS